MSADELTPYPDVNAMIQQLLPGVQAILGRGFVGMYLDGSLANGDFDEDSDIDFVVVSEERVTAEQFGALQVMHDRLATLDSPYATDLEGSYLSRHALRRHHAEDAVHPNIERGRGERLKWREHEAVWLVHRAVLRERGIVVVGPAATTLIDPVSPRELQQVMREVAQSWAVFLRDQTGEIREQGYQSYVVLTLCRILYTLETGRVGSKRVAAEWARERLDARWSALIDRAWAGRHTPNLPVVPEELEETMRLLRYVVEQCEQPGQGADD